MNGIAQIGIGTTSPHSSAQLDITSNNKGLLPPRLTTLERNSIDDPAEGLIIYNKDTECIEWLTSSGWFNACNGQIIFSANLCDNDIFTNAGTGNIVHIKYNYTGTYNTANYDWCAREVEAAGYTWLDRNLGAYRVPTTSTDIAGYGDLYQWGRSMDGHSKIYQRTGDPDENSGSQGQIVNWNTNTNADNPPNALFITEVNSPYDWRINQDSTLWEVQDSSNNPCPNGYRVPTFDELQDLVNNYSPFNANTAFSSPLKMPKAGFRHYFLGSGNIYNDGSDGFYWSKTTAGSFVWLLNFVSMSGNLILNYRANGGSVRCIKE